MSARHKGSRRAFLKSTGVLLGAAALPATVLRTARGQTLDGTQPLLAQGIQIGDVDASRAVIWSRAEEIGPRNRGHG